MSRVSGAYGPEGLHDVAGATDGRWCAVEGRPEGADGIARSLGLSPELGVEPVLAEGFHARRLRLLDALGGTFALLVWDGRLGEGILACDPLGTRSIFYRSHQGVVHFSTDIRDLLSAGRSEPAADAVSRLLAHGSLERDETLFQGIRRLAGGEVLHLRGGTWEVRTYWRPRYREPSPMGLLEAAECVRLALARAVSARCGARTGVLLSGGLDSTSVAASAPAGSSLRAYSASFPDHPQTDETTLIHQTTRLLGLDSRIHVVRPTSVLAAAAEHTRRWNVPAASPNLFFHDPLVELAQDDGVDTLLDGEGGDELFGVAPAIRDETLSLAARAGAILRRTRRPPSLLRRPSLVRRDPGEPGRLELDGPSWWKALADQLTGARERMGVHDHFRRNVARARLNGGHPLLDDLPLIDLVLGLPPELAADERLDRPVLREAMRGLVGDHVRLRETKSTFDQVLIDCMLGADRELLGNLLDPRRAAVAAYVRPELLARFAEPPSREQATLSWAWTAWRLASVELWLRALASDMVVRPSARESGGDSRTCRPHPLPGSAQKAFSRTELVERSR
jgi:asparagine synthetase B (glutamine-hydrolysing)